MIELRAIPVELSAPKQAAADLANLTKMHADIRAGEDVVKLEAEAVTSLDPSSMRASAIELVQRLADHRNNKLGQYIARAKYLAAVDAWCASAVTGWATDRVNVLAEQLQQHTQRIGLIAIRKGEVDADYRTAHERHSIAEAFLNAVRNTQQAAQGDLGKLRREFAGAVAQLVA